MSNCSMSNSLFQMQLLPSSKIISNRNCEEALFSKEVVQIPSDVVKELLKKLSFCSRKR